jgi:hypothetical protein
MIDSLGSHPSDTLVDFFLVCVVGEVVISFIEITGSWKQLCIFLRYCHSKIENGRKNQKINRKFN